MPKIVKTEDGYETRLSLTDPLTGKRTQPRIHARTRRELDSKIAALRTRHDRGELTEPSGMTVADAVRAWYADIDVRESTKIQYDQLVTRHILPDPIAALPLVRLRLSHVEDWISRKRAEGHAPRHVRMMHRTLSAALARAVRREEIPKNPAAGVGNLPSVPKDPPRALSSEQVRTLLDGVRGDRYECLITIAVTLGLRRGELLALRWDDVDLDAATLSVKRTMTRVHEPDGSWMWIIGDAPKTAHSIRTIPLPLTCQTMLRRHRIAQDERLMRAGLPLSAWVFDRGDGNHYLRPEPVDGRFKQIVSRLGLPEWTTLHALRHTAASHFLRSGVTLPMAARILGHRDGSVTMQVYAHILRESETAAIGLIEGMYGTSDCASPAPPSEEPLSFPHPHATKTGT